MPLPVLHFWQRSKGNSRQATLHVFLPIRTNIRSSLSNDDTESIHICIAVHKRKEVIRILCHLHSQIQGWVFRESALTKTTNLLTSVGSNICTGPPLHAITNKNYKTALAECLLQRPIVGRSRARILAGTSSYLPHYVHTGSVAHPAS